MTERIPSQRQVTEISFLHKMAGYIEMELRIAVLLYTLSKEESRKFEQFLRMLLGFCHVILGRDFETNQKGEHFDFTTCMGTL